MDSGTFFGYYDKKIDEWEVQIKNESDPQRRYKLKSEMYEYMAGCLPYLTEYMKDTDEDKVVQGPFNTTIKQGVKRQELYYDYLINVEGYKGAIPQKTNYTPQKLNCFICSNEKCKSSNVFIDSRSSNYICKDCGTC